MVFDESAYLSAVRENDPATTSAVADAVGVTRQGADYRLRKLESEGLVTKQMVGNTLIWSVVEGAESPVTPTGRERDDTPAPERERSPRPTAPRDEAESEGPDPLADVEFPQSRERGECIEAVEAARDYIRDHGSATMRELVGDVMPEYPVGYRVPELEEGDRYRGGWWRHVVKPGLEALPEIEKPKAGGSDWRWVGD